MPTCDRPAFVPIAIACFLAQDFTDSELVILDDGAGKVAGLIPQSDRIRYFPLEGKLKTGQKRNMGANLAHGEIVVHLDDDDWSAPNRISQQVARLESSGKQVTGYNSVLFYDSRDGKCYRYRGGNTYTLGTSQCYRKTWWAGHRFQESQIGEDTAFGHEAAKFKQLDAVPGEGMIVAVVHGKNTSPKPLNSTIYAPVERSVLPAGFFSASEAYATV
jgi:glycosyltransferase involved in cell wall biosynthesis